MTTTVTSTTTDWSAPISLALCLSENNCRRLGATEKVGRSVGEVGVVFVDGVYAGVRALRTPSATS